MVVTDFKLRYQGSVLGYLWSLLKPLALFAVLWVVFSNFLRLGDSVENFAVYLLLGVVIWTFFAEMSAISMGSIVGRGELLRKINFPKYVIVLSSAFSALINLAFNMVVVVLFAALSGVSFDLRVLWMIPLSIELFVFSLAVGFLLSALYVKFRDMNFIWEVVLQGAFYATPILYPLSFIPDTAVKLIMLSPMAQIIQDMRWAMVWDGTDTMSDVYDSPWIRLVPVGMAILLMIMASWYFKRQSQAFAEAV